MSFEDLKSAVAARAGLSKAQTDQAITAFMEHVQTSLSQGDKISLPGRRPVRGDRAGRASGDATRGPAKP